MEEPVAVDIIKLMIETNPGIDKELPQNDLKRIGFSSFPQATTSAVSVDTAPRLSVTDAQAKIVLDEVEKQGGSQLAALFEASGLSGTGTGIVDVGLMKDLFPQTRPPSTSPRSDETEKKKEPDSTHETETGVKSLLNA